ncbi:MAG: glycosyltransferase family 87 protein [Polyangiales bacterium]
MSDDGRDDAPIDPRVSNLVLLGVALVVGAHAWSQYRPYTFLHGDGSFYAIVNQSLAEGTLEQSRFQPMSWYRLRLRWNDELDPGWSNLALGADGRSLWPKHPLLLPLLHAPLFHAFGLNGLLLGSVALSVLSLWLAFRVAARVASTRAAACASLAFAATPLLLHNAYSYSNDVLYTALALAAIDATQRARGAFAGLLWGLALAAKPTLALLAAPFVAPLVARRRWGTLARLALGASLPLGALALANTVMFGGPGVHAYNRILVRHGGAPALFDLRARFGRALVAGLRAIVADRQQGLARSAPGALLVLPGVLALARAPRGRAFAAAFAASLGATALLYARFEFTYARFFTPWVVLSVVPAAALLDVGAARVARWREGASAPPWLRAALEDPRWFPLTLGALTVIGVAPSSPPLGAALALACLAASRPPGPRWARLAALAARLDAGFTRPRRVAALAVVAALCLARPAVMGRFTRDPRWRATAALRAAAVRLVPSAGPRCRATTSTPRGRSGSAPTGARRGHELGPRAGRGVRVRERDGRLALAAPNPGVTRGDRVARALPPETSACATASRRRRGTATRPRCCSPGRPGDGSAPSASGRWRRW